MNPAESTLAEGRVVRTILTVLGLAAIAYGLLSVGPVLDQERYVRAAWMYPAAFVVFGVPPILALVSRFVSLSTLRTALGVYCVLFVTVVVTWVPAMTAVTMPVATAPWPLAITSLGTVPAALAFRPPLAWAALLVNSAALAAVRFVASGGEYLAVSLQDGLFGAAFSAIFTAVAIVAIRTATTLDAAAAVARSNAASAASADARSHEQARLDALVHDEIITSLSYATQRGPDVEPLVRAQAQRALVELARLGSEQRETEPVAVDAFVNQLRSILLALAPDIPLRVTGDRTTSIPAPVAAAFAEGAAEAVRNSLRHAPGASRRVFVSVREPRISVEIADTGPGFDPSAVDPYRLGIAVSIRGRMDAVPGGRARITSSPGGGARVALSWESQ